MKQYEHLLALFLKHLEEYKAQTVGKLPLELYEPENYILSLGGKRLRPLLALIACDLFDTKPELALNSALCVELFHNFSLIHDDILDAAPLRRNKETVHTKWNTNIAILSGDVMLVKAFSALENYPAQQFKELSMLFSRTAVEVCEGQQNDMNFENSETISVDDYVHMITQKTAVLLACSLQMGAVNAGAGKNSQDNIYEFGKHLGIAFQLLDDVLDTYSETPEFGKQTGGDIIANKKTFLLLKAFELCNETQKQELKKLMALKEIDASEKVKRVKLIFDKLNIRAISLEKATEHTKIAMEFLDKLNANAEKKENLKRFASELLNRSV